MPRSLTQKRKEAPERCKLKKVYKNRLTAIIGLLSLMKDNYKNEANKDKNIGLSIYICEFCNNIHLGHWPKKLITKNNIEQGEFILQLGERYMIVPLNKNRLVERLSLTRE